MVYTMNVNMRQKAKARFCVTCVAVELHTHTHEKKTRRRCRYKHMPGSCGRKKGHGKTNQDLLDRGRYERCSTTARVGNTEHQMQPKKRNVFLLKANIIGYFRIVLILLALRVREQPEVCTFEAYTKLHMPYSLVLHN